VVDDLIESDDEAEGGKELLGFDVGLSGDINGSAEERYGNVSGCQIGG